MVHHTITWCALGMVFLNAPCAKPDDSHGGSMSLAPNRGDRPDLGEYDAGGIRWIIPEKADYWSGRGK